MCISAQSIVADTHAVPVIHQTEKPHRFLKGERKPCVQGKAPNAIQLFSEGIFLKYHK